MKVINDEKKIDELLTRGIENIFPNRDFVKSKMLKGEQLTLYLGIDPTGPTLHMGHVIPLIRLGKFQQLGHKIILLMGDFTAMIGDPTDKMATRKKLSHQEVLENLKEYKKQASKFISFSGSNPAEFKFNSEWLGKMNFADVLELASHFTVQQIISREMFAQRISEDKPVYIHEFLYPLMQGYDSVAMDVDGEIGGNDQTFNMLAGRDLMKSLKNKEKFVIATNLLVDSSGKKMGKTENNMISLDQDAKEIFGKVMSWNDELIIPGFKIITDVSVEDISLMKESLDEGKNPRDSKIKLANEIVKMFFDEKSAQEAEENFMNTFSKGGVPDDVLEVNADTDAKLMDVVVAEKIVDSKTEFRRLVSDGAVTNMDTGEKVADVDAKVDKAVYKIGKHRFIKIK